MEYQFSKSAFIFSLRFSSNRNFLFQISNMIHNLLLKHGEPVVIKNKNIYSLQINIYTW